MPLADSNGPRWARRQRVISEQRLAGAGPIRRFLAALFGRSQPRLDAGGPRFPGDDPGAAGAGRLAPLPPRVRTLAGGAARRLEDEPGDA